MSADPKKVCTICKRGLPLGRFARKVGMKDGHLNQCGECVWKKQRLAIKRPTMKARFFS